MRGMLVLVVGLFGLAWLNHENSLADPLLPYREQIAEAKAWVKEKARDPRTVAFHHVAVGGDETKRVYLDFSWENGLGGMSRKRYRFDFAGNTDLLQVVREDETGKVVAVMGKTLENVRALQAGDEEARRIVTDARVERALEVGGGKAPTLVPGKAVVLPPVPGLGQ